uniref:K Homology domain-containing protein n=1 Tax=Pyramimonas obovata TaxID=1411642 RepID=A0A7S0N5T6_9CHLO|mmetsp:Transcript_18816/g.41179  ORF Transcript_18816/g.41179 Transcript_18816/m.41179 type:complete len:481 (+) Transcript_18816:139-1581(+)|eukprot:CAMPEP_0118931428 /NCGR_PEP_ID=MMETSP1169-20130426/7773_1 /TAXON_ID=36882 /ORGANISM="Pyramimonas obovata, Strain CCMP722" /LENGTH=480 /DNA_ID=CAMNT_0006873927 /DNA_START=139 /DNA_END=1581 /DNA_ORIENTATION=-
MDGLVLSSHTVASGQVADVANFFLSCKNGDSDAAVSFLRNVLSYINPHNTDDDQPRKKQRSEATPAELSEPARETTKEALVLDYFENDEMDQKPGTVVMLVPNRQHLLGAIIGKSGTNMNYVQQQSGSRVQLEKKENAASPTMEITITGTVATNNVAVSLLFDKVIQHLKSRDQTSDPFASSLKLIVPNQTVRHLIGKQGNVINALQSTSQAHIQFQNESEMPYGALGRTVTITAPEQSSIQKAEYLISRRMADDSKYDPSWAQNLRKGGGVAQSSSIAPINQLPLPSLPTTTLDQSMSLGYEQMFSQQLQQQQQQLQQAMLQLQQQQQQQQPLQYTTAQFPTPSSIPVQQYTTPGQQYTAPGQNLSSGIGGYYGYGQPSTVTPTSFNAPSLGGSSSGGGSDSIECLVPNQWVSRLIGKAGAHITDMQNKTGARIQFQKEKDMAPGSVSRKVTLTGTPAATAAAQQIINNTVASLQSQGI